MDSQPGYLSRGDVQWLVAKICWEKFELSSIVPASLDIPQTKVKFDVAEKDMFNLQAADKSKGKQNKITIINDKGGLTESETGRMVQEE